jgi:hypothetical protein
MFSRAKRALTSVALMMAIVTPTVVSSIAEAQMLRNQTNTVLTSVNGQNLTQGMVNNAIAFGEFLAGEKFTLSEISSLKEAAVKEFRNNPTSTIQGYNTIAQVLSQIRQLNNPVARAQVREKLFTKIYLNQLAKQTLNEPGLMTTVYKHSPVIAADSANELVVSKQGLKSYFDCYNFIAQLVGIPLIKTEEKARTLQYLQQNFHTFAHPNKVLLAKAESSWINLQQVWASWSPKDKQMKIEALKKLAKNSNIATLPFALEDVAWNSQSSQTSQNLINSIDAKIRQLQENMIFCAGGPYVTTCSFPYRKP